jgi:hypothetical protein
VGCSRAVLAAFKVRYSLARRSGSEARLSGGLDTRVSTSFSSSDGDNRDMARLNGVGNDLYVNTMANLWDVSHCLEYRGIYGPLLVAVPSPECDVGEGHSSPPQLPDSAVRNNMVHRWPRLGFGLDCAGPGCLDIVSLMRAHPMLSRVIPVYLSSDIKRPLCLHVVGSSL